MKTSHYPPEYPIHYFLIKSYRKMSEAFLALEWQAVFTSGLRFFLPNYFNKEQHNSTLLCIARAVKIQ